MSLRSPRSDSGFDGRAFTLIELLLVLALSAVAASVLFGLVDVSSERAKRLQAESEIAAIAAALESYRRTYGDYPQTDSSQQLLASLSGQRGPTGAAVAGPIFLLSQGITLGNLGVSDPDPVLLDPWGAPYRYHYDPAVYPGSGYAFWSPGPDGSEHLDGPGRWSAEHPDNRDNLSARAR